MSLPYCKIDISAIFILSVFYKGPDTISIFVNIVMAVLKQYFILMNAISNTNVWPIFVNINFTILDYILASYCQ